MKKKKDREVTGPVRTCVCCKKCTWVWNDTLKQWICPYGGPFAGYEDATDGSPIEYKARGRALTGSNPACD